MDTMGIIWLVVFGAIGIVAVRQLVSTTRTHDNQKYYNNETNSIKSISEREQRLSCFITGTPSDRCSDDSNKPVLNIKTAQEFLKVSYPSAQNAISSLEQAGILTEITGRKRAKAYSANEILKALDEEITSG